MRGMEAIEDILGLLAEGTPFSLARFNDGEAMGALSAGCKVARGRQKVDAYLQERLRLALTRDTPSQWIGVPCRKCFSRYRRFIDGCIEGRAGPTTLAVVLTNRNIARWKDAAPQILSHRDVVWVGSREHRVDRLPFGVLRHVKVNAVNAWACEARIFREHEDLPIGSVCLLSCGPLATVLAVEWHAARPDVTFIDVGSVWDPETQDLSYRCHDGTLPPCKECN